MATTKPSVNEPLTDTDRREIDRGLYMLNQMLPQLDKAEAAGIDVTDLRLRRDDMYNSLAKIKAAYFPHSQ